MFVRPLIDLDFLHFEKQVYELIADIKRLEFAE